MKLVLRYDSRALAMRKDRIESAIVKDFSI